MGLSCGLVGLPSCGKTVIFNAITAAGVLSHNGSEVNRVVVSVPDARLDRLAQMYHPRKVVPATLEVVDIPGLETGGNGRGSRLLGHIKDVEVLLHVVRCFANGSVPDPLRDVETVDMELMVADAGTLEAKIARLAKKARGGDKDALRETADCEKVYKALQEGVPVRRQALSARELTSIRECNLVSQKSVLYIANVGATAGTTNGHVDALSQIALAEGTELIAISGKDEADISQFKPDEREAFLKELGLANSSVERLLTAAYRKLGLINFFTTGEDEVRAWTCRCGDKAPVAAGKIHTDMEKGFIRMEVIRYQDLMELGSEAAVSKAGRHRVEGREYELQDADIVTVLFNKG
ncbi:MAG: redox-regulated ATPase YchF [Chloroflexota bacterium]